jgi:hypothetical protein
LYRTALTVSLDANVPNGGSPAQAVGRSVEAYCNALDRAEGENARVVLEWDRDAAARHAAAAAAAADRLAEATDGYGATDWRDAFLLGAGGGAAAATESLVDRATSAFVGGGGGGASSFDDDRWTKVVRLRAMNGCDGGSAAYLTLRVTPPVEGAGGGGDVVVARGPRPDGPPRGPKPDGPPRGPKPDDGPPPGPLSG